MSIIGSWKPQGSIPEAGYGFPRGGGLHPQGGVGATVEGGGGVAGGQGAVSEGESGDGGGGSTRLYEKGFVVAPADLLAGDVVSVCFQRVLLLVLVLGC